jgi:uncharacterized protein (DUF927 family)
MPTDKDKSVVVPIRPNEDRAEQTAREETKIKAALLKWAGETADAVIAAILDDIALHFMEDEADDDGEQLSLVDLMGDYDPIIDPQTGSRLSDVIKEASATLHKSEKMLKQLYVSALQRKWASHHKEFPSEPTGQLYTRSYLVNRHGVWFRRAIARLDDLYVWRRITKTRIDPEALSYDTTPQRNWQYRYRVTGEIGAIPVDIDAVQVGKAADGAIKTLIRHGVHVVESKEARQRLAQFLQHRPQRRIVRAPRTGWFEWRRDWTFVLPDEVLGATDKMHIILDGVTSGAGGYGFHRAGTSDEWREHVAAPAAGNSSAVLAVGTMLAGPLLRSADEPAGGFHLYGDSKIGKTLVCAIGQSVWGKPFSSGDPDPGAFGFDWNTTAARLEERAVLRNDCGLYLDEIGVGDQKAIRTAIYELAGGRGKGRMRQSEATFNLLFLSTGEQSIVRFLRDVRVGQTVRLTDIPAEVQPGSAFELYDSEAAARRFYPAVREYHGTIGYDFLQYLIAQTSKTFKPRLKELRAMFLAQPRVAEIASAHAQVRHVINRFALTAATLALAVEAGILPWSRSDTDNGVVACMRRWAKQRGNLDVAGELLHEIERRRILFAATAQDRLIHLAVVGRRLVAASPADQHKLEAVEHGYVSYDGYVKNERILLTPTAWHRLWASLDVEVVNRHLMHQQLLIPGLDEGDVTSVEKVRSGAKPARFYVLAPRFIEIA